MHVTVGLRTVTPTLDWCVSQMQAEKKKGLFSHRASGPQSRRSHGMQRNKHVRHSADFGGMK